MTPPVLRRALLLAGLALAYSAQASKPLVMGFSQVGAESEWRTANTASVKSAAQAAGIQLKFADAQQKQENQIKAIRSFIAQKVDVIAFSPVVESGFETVLREAKAAKIPVILTDRAVKVSDPSLYVTFIGSDFVEEGRKAARWVLDQAKDGRALNIAELQGTPRLWLHLAGGLLVLGRVIHPIGLKATAPTHPLRIAGNSTNLLATVILTIAISYAAFIG